VSEVHPRSAGLIEHFTSPDPTWAIGRSQAHPLAQTWAGNAPKKTVDAFWNSRRGQSATRTPPRRAIMRREGAEWKKIFQIIDAACADYLTGMATLRKRVVDDVIIAAS